MPYIHRKRKRQPTNWHNFIRHRKELQFRTGKLIVKYGVI